MSISLFCYSSRPPEDVRRILNCLTLKHGEIFSERFLISEFDDLSDPKTYYDSVSVEIALEHGLRASCLFLVSLNEKSFANFLPAVEAIIKNALGDSNVLILFNNEERR